MPKSQASRAQILGISPALGMIALLGASLVSAETIEGRINGLRCAQAGHVCPIDNLDAHLSFELEFVLQQPDGQYYYLSNVPRDTKVRHVRKQAKVTGTLIDEYHSISVDALFVDGGNGYRQVWSPEAQQGAFEQMYNSGWNDTPARDPTVTDAFSDLP